MCCFSDSFGIQTISLVPTLSKFTQKQVTPRKRNSQLGEYSGSKQELQNAPFHKLLTLSTSLVQFCICFPLDNNISQYDNKSSDNVFFCIFSNRNRCCKSSVLIPGSETLLDWDLRRLEVMTFTAAMSNPRTGASWLY